MRSAPPLAPWMNWLPSSTIAAHCDATASEPSGGPPSGGGPDTALVASASSAKPHSAASASWSIWSFGTLMPSPYWRCPRASLDDDFLKQHGVDAAWRDRKIDPAGKLLLETVKAGGAVEIGRAQFAQIGLERVHHPRHGGLDL